MTNIQFSKEELKEARAYYSEDKLRLEAKLDHVNGMIAKLGGSVRVASIKKSKVTAKGVKPKKRGPKSIWGDFIIKRLRARNKPMSYGDLIDDAMAIHKLSEDRVGAARASILNSAFRLRTVHGKIETVGRAGRKEKLIVLTKWLNEDGMLQEEYAKAFKKMQGGKAVRVDMSAVPVSPYEDDEA
ncbi:MAG: hypothetical protein COA49_04605 [Bacteroidetes bacterium]|nr:MAG: hypothetical protein COA49_04605 [Bacteroidota bacterium]